MRPGDASLTFGPTAIYPLKAAATRVRSLLWLLKRARESDERGLRILLYHRVSDDRDPLSVSPVRFRGQMGVLAESGLEAVDVSEAAKRVLVDRQAAQRVVGLSFD